MPYNPADIEKKWQNYWKDNKSYKVENDTSKSKYYVLDMFPYPSGSGLHVGHPLGYIASDIYSRYKRLKGFNVLHPMGFDAFGLPAEQYAIQTGKHPEEVTQKNIAYYREQLNNIGLSYDWDREVQTCDPKYYKWTQWIFSQMFNSYYCNDAKQARPVSELEEVFGIEGNKRINAHTTIDYIFNKEDWDNYSAKEKSEVLMHYRLAYRKISYVNWCEALGTVLANDEVVNGVSERGGHPVVQKPMEQWSLRITAYAERLLQGLNDLDWSSSLKTQQENWIGKSVGAQVRFKLLTPNPSPQEREAFWATGNPKMGKQLLKMARENRKDPTEAEDVMWQALRNRALKYKFRRQHPIDSFIVDFVCMEKKLIVEIDGEIHDLLEHKEYDKHRGKILEELGYNVIRFKNNEVKNDLKSVLEKIKSELVTPSPLERVQGEENSPSLLERGAGGEELEVFTTRPDTIFGVTFMVLAPEHELVNILITAEQKTEVDAYVQRAKSRSSIERQAEKNVSGVFTGSYAIHPFTEEKIPIWISEYVLIEYGTGAIMAVPSDDDRDHAFATHFNLPIIDIIDKTGYPDAERQDKVGKMINSGFINGMKVKDAIKTIISELEKKGIGKEQVNYKLRDANFSRQRYWGEPFPIKYDNDDVPTLVEDLPVELPPLKNFQSEGGKPPLSKATEWLNEIDGFTRETDTMPGNAGSSWYFLRYMDPENDDEPFSKQAVDYWQDVDLYIGGTEHAVGHLMYARFWHKFLHDLGHVPTQEPFKKLVNQGMIQGNSAFAYSVVWSLYKGLDSLSKKSKFNGVFVVPKDMIKSFDEENQSLEEYPELSEFILNNYDVENIDDFKIKGFNPIRIDINYIKNEELDINAIVSDTRFSNCIFIKNHNDSFKCYREVEKMGKSKLNVTNPDDVVAEYGVDCFRMFEMFLGPIEASKPWNTQGISGVAGFLKKLWNLFYDNDELRITDEKPNEKELKILHTCIKKVNEDIERFSFNTCVSAFMICVNELGNAKCYKRSVLEELVKLLSPFAPHVAEEFWQNTLGNNSSVVKDITYPEHNEEYLTESAYEYPVSINGKMRVKMPLALDLSQEDAQATVLANEVVQKWMDGKPLRKFIYIKGRIINIVV